MDDLTHELERAIPHVEPVGLGVAALTSAGRAAVRRRRARVGSAVATGGLVVAGLAVGATLVAGGGQPADPGTAAPADTPDTASVAPAPQALSSLSLVSLQRVADTCGEVTLDREAGILVSGGRTVDASGTVEGAGWTAEQYPCGPDLVRVLQVDDGGVVARVAASDDESLRSWAEAGLELAPR